MVSSDTVTVNQREGCDFTAALDSAEHVPAYRMHENHHEMGSTAAAAAATTAVRLVRGGLDCIFAAHRL